jgi:predicted lipoprotein with Yx(FWY)xxD motif
VKRSLIPITALVAAAVMAAAALAAAPTVKLAHTGAGKILVNGRGFTVFVFSKDGHKKDVCMTKKGCPSVWPAVTTKAKPLAGPGLKARLLGTIKLAHGGKQVTYAGHPLYHYSFDSSPASTDYVGQPDFGGHWDAINAAGHVVK